MLDCLEKIPYDPGGQLQQKSWRGGVRDVPRWSSGFVNDGADVLQVFLPGIV